jgi:hypothetical protein
MISRRQLPELRAFARAESGLPFRSAPEYASLVIPNGNSGQPVHQWFRYKESFSADLLKHVVEQIGVERSTESRIRLLDPFCGVGTTLLSAQVLGRPDLQIDSIGIECNPFSTLVAKTKISWRTIDPERLRRLGAQVLAKSAASTATLPRLSSILSGRCISRHMAKQIVGVRAQIESLAPSVERDALLVGLAACIETVSKVRRDGRALRIIEKPRAILKRVLADRWASMADDVDSLQRSCPDPAQAEVIHGDGRAPLTAGIADATVDLILTSPPYPNNIDYNEIYKLELWFLGFATSAEDFLLLRRQTFRSHPTCSPPEEEKEFDDLFRQVLKGPLEELLGVVVRRVKSLDNDCSRGRGKVLLGYAFDTWRTLRAHAQTLRRGGRAVYVVGNSLHGGPASRPYLVPTDLIFSKLAETVGLQVDDLVVARPLQRRLAGNHFLRDSLVVLRKP